MTDHDDHTPDDRADQADREADGALAAAGARLRRSVTPVTPAGVERAALRRRLRRMGGIAAVATVVALVAGVAVGLNVGGDDEQAARPGTSAPSSEEVDELVAALDEQPIDPADVELVASVSAYDDCDALIDDLRSVGAAHVGSRGFGGWTGGFPGWVEATREGGDFAAEGDASAASMAPQAGDESGAAGGETLGTNVQVVGVDELDRVKAEGDLVYDLTRAGALRITDTTDLTVAATLDLVPEGIATGSGPGAGGDDGEPGLSATVDELLVADGRVVVIGTETEVAPPVEGDPSATRAATQHMTATFVDATDPAAPAVTDRVRIEGSLVAARLVDGEVRLVTTSPLADLGFVMPTSPASVPIALDQNRRIVASSTVADWIPDWQRDGEDPQPLVPCERVYVPDTFAGVAMTSMVTFPLGGGAFEPAGTSLVAPGTTLYAGTEKVAISSEVWVDPVDRDALEVDDWRTAVHEFSFGDAAADAAAPTYEGSGVVDGSTVGQFAFGEIGESLAVVSTAGTPWRQGEDPVIDLTVLTPDGAGALDATARVEDLAEGRGAVSAVRFVEGRVLVSTGFGGREVSVIDVSEPSAPRRAGRVTVPGEVGYFHPLPDGRALVLASRGDEVGSGDDRRYRPWVVAHLLDVGDADAPSVLSTWERPWSTDVVAYDHHAFTWWPDRGLAMWGVAGGGQDGLPSANHAVVLGVDEAVTEVAVPEASRAPEAPAPCPELEVTDPELVPVVGDMTVLRCAPDVEEVDWPRYRCYRADEDMVAAYAPDEVGTASFMLCSPAGPPTVSRVLVVSGTPYLLTEQTLERLDPETFASTAVVHHPGASAGW